MASLDVETILNQLRLLKENSFPDEAVHQPTPETLRVLLQPTAPPTSPRPLGDVIAEAQDLLSLGFRHDHPRFFSYIPAPVSPVSWLGDVITTAFNPFPLSHMASPGVCGIEKALVQWIGRDIFGLPASVGGQFVSGGSVASLSALTVARDQMLGETQRHNGIAYISVQTHFCISRALKIIGIAVANIRTVPCNSGGRLDVTQLEIAIQEDLQRGNRPFLIVATCGTTNTGSIDPMEAISVIAWTYNMWVHVDAAYGGSAAFSTQYRPIVKGIERADSIAWDAHKWFFQTSGCSLVLYRDRTHPLASFSSTGPYVNDIEAEEDDKVWKSGLEMTRPARHMRLWFTLQALGTDALSAMVSKGFELAKVAEAELRKLSDWEVLSPAQMAIVVFRFAPAHNKGVYVEDLDHINYCLSQELARRGIAAVFTTQLKGVRCLRMCTINPNTTEAEVQRVVRSLDVIASEFLCPAQSPAGMGLQPCSVGAGAE